MTLPRRQSDDRSTPVRFRRENVELRQVAERFIAGVTGGGDPGRAERGSR
ncbi:hypothetical protein [Amycolatopsis decaplanina]|nr:hypothetical protein [Amycolatopsis decaplanina]